MKTNDLLGYTFAVFIQDYSDDTVTRTAVDLLEDLFRIDLSDSCYRFCPAQLQLLYQKYFPEHQTLLHEILGESTRNLWLKYTETLPQLSDDVLTATCPSRFSQMAWTSSSMIFEKGGFDQMKDNTEVLWCTTRTLIQTLETDLYNYLLLKSQSVEVFSKTEACRNCFRQNRPSRQNSVSTASFPTVGLR